MGLQSPIQSAIFSNKDSPLDRSETSRELSQQIKDDRSEENKNEDNSQSKYNNELSLTRRAEKEIPLAKVNKSKRKAMYERKMNEKRKKLMDQAPKIAYEIGSFDWDDILPSHVLT